VQLAVRKRSCQSPRKAQLMMTHPAVYVARNTMNLQQTHDRNAANADYGSMTAVVLEKIYAITVSANRLQLLPVFV